MTTASTTNHRSTPLPQRRWRRGTELETYASSCRHAFFASFFCFFFFCFFFFVCLTTNISLHSDYLYTGTTTPHVRDGIHYDDQHRQPPPPPSRCHVTTHRQRLQPTIQTNDTLLLEAYIACVTPLSSLTLMQMKTPNTYFHLSAPSAVTVQKAMNGWKHMLDVKRESNLQRILVRQQELQGQVSRHASRALVCFFYTFLFTNFYFF
jgi:hypothetical protein